MSNGIFKADSYKVQIGNPNFERYQSWNELGLVETGIQLQHVYNGQPITSYGSTTVIDGIYRGGSCFLNITIQEWSVAAVQQLLYQHQQLPHWGQSAIQITNPEGHEGFIGCSWWSLSLPVRLIRRENVGCASSPSQYLFYASILAEDQSVEWALANALYAVPLRLRCLPDTDEANGGRRWYIATY